MSSRGWGTAWVILPHDGAYGDKVFATSYESAIREAGFDVLVVPNQGAGAAKARIETPRRHFPRIFFNAETTRAETLLGPAKPRWRRFLAERLTSRIHTGHI